MRRSACGRDFALSARMGVTSLLLVGLYSAALLPPIWLFLHGILPAKFAFGFEAIVVVLVGGLLPALPAVASSTDIGGAPASSLADGWSWDG